jgi:hypothetical protein
MEVSGHLHATAALPPGEKAPCTYWIGGWVGPRAGLDDAEKRKFLTLPGLELIQYTCRIVKLSYFRFEMSP